MDTQLTRIVNIKNSQYDIYIGRADKGQNGYFGNPFIVRKWEDRPYILEKYKEYFDFRITNDPEFKKRIHELKGKVLGCFCKPLQCHGDVIVEYLNTLPENTII